MKVASGDLPALQDVPVVLISALPEQELRERMLQTGAVDALPKPFRAGDLIRCVQRSLAAGR